MTGKTKLGIPVTVMAAFLYFSGLSGSSVVMIGLILYVLLFEEDDLLKKAAKQAFVLFLLFSVLFGTYGIIGQIVALVSTLADEYYALPVAIQQIFNLIESLVYFIFGVEALFGKHLRLGAIQGMTGEQSAAAPRMTAPMGGNTAAPNNNMNMGNVAGPNMAGGNMAGFNGTAPNAAGVNTADMKFCQNCGEPLKADTVFCTRCGARQK